MALRRQKSRKQQIAELAVDYMKIKAATKAAKGTAVYKVAKKTPIVKRIPVVVGAGLATLAAVKVARGRGHSETAPA